MTTKPLRGNCSVNSQIILLLITLFWAAAASAQQPVNDSFTNRIFLTGTNVTSYASNVGATSEPGELSLGLDAAGKTIWWTWFATANATVTVSLQSGSVPHLLGVCTGNSVSNLFLLDSGTNVSFTALPGESYYFVADGFAGASSEGSVVLRLQISVAPPVNDMFTNATELTGTNMSVVGSIVNATTEPGEPSFVPDALRKTVWWNWTAPVDGNLRLSTRNYSLVRSSGLAVFTGDNVAALTLVTNGIFSMSVRVTGGTIYRIGADGVTTFGGGEGLVGFNLNFEPTPPNDMFADRTVLIGNHIDVTGTTRLGTLEEGEPLHSVFGIRDSHSVWWSWTPTSNGVVVINQRLGLSEHLAVYTGNSLQSLRTVTKSDYGAVVFGATAGTAYQIVIASDDYSTSVRLQLDWSETPANDFFANRFTLTGTNVVVTGSNTNASSELDEPVSNRDGFELPVKSSLWWTWTAPLSGKATFDVRDCVFFPLLTIFTGDTLTTLTQVAWGDWFQSAEVHVTAGQTYQISIASPPTLGFVRTGDVVMRLTAAPVPLLVSQPTPAAQIARVGDSVRFDVTASGEPPLRYQWRLNGIPLSGRTNDSLTLSPVGLNLNGAYSVEVTDANQTIVSSNAALVVLPPPRNDMFSHVKELFGTNIVVTGSSLGATIEPGEFYSGPAPFEGSIWWTWTAPHSGETTVNALGIPFSFDVAVSTGNSVSSLKSVGYCRTGSFLSFPAVAGTKYRIRVSGLFSPEGNSRLHLRQDRSNAPRITLQPTSVSVSLRSSASFSVRASGRGPLQYQWRQNGRALRGATNANLNLRDVSKLNLGIYDVVVTDVFGTATSVEARLSTRWLPAANDYFAQATLVSGMSVHRRGSSEFATSEPDGYFHFPAVWWNWTAPEDGDVVLSTYGTIWSAELAVFTGDTLASLTPVASQTQSITNQNYNILTFHARKKTTYRIGVATPLATTGYDFTLHLVENDADRAPTFFEQPEDQPVLVGGTVTWALQVFGRQPMRYQWQFNGVNLRNQTNATLTIDGVKSAQAGQYRLVARNAVGVAVSRAASLFPYSPTGTTTSPGIPIGGPGPGVINDPPITTVVGSHSNLVIRSRLNGQFARCLIEGTNISVLPLGEPIAPEWRFVAEKDLKHDGQKEMILQSANGAVVAVPVSGTNLLQGSLIDDGTVITADWKLLAVVDLNSDGSPDLIAQNTDGTVVVWYLTGTELLDKTPTAFTQLSRSSDARVVATADFNADGLPDLLWEENGYFDVSLMAGTRCIFQIGLFGGEPVATGWHVIGVDDLNGDGKPDLIVQDETGTVRVELLNGFELLKELTLDTAAFAVGDWEIVGPK